MRFSNPCTGADRRTCPRHPANRSIYVCDGAIARRCELIDISDGGARIALGGTRLPDRIVLVDPQTGLSRLAALVWRSESEIGVGFLEAGLRYRVLRSTRDLTGGIDQRLDRCAS